MTPHQIDLVQRSFSAAAPIRDQLAAEFYERLFNLDPALRGLFPKGSMSEQGRKLTTVLGFAVGGLRQPDEILPAVRDLGHRHVSYGVKREHYATVGEALLEALAATFGSAFTDELRLAWTEAYVLLSGVMLAATDEEAA